MLTVVADGCPGHDDSNDEVSPSLIDEIVREGARRMLAGALRGEVDADVAAFAAGRFASATLPPWACRTPKVAEVLPLLYLHGLSSGDFVPALGQFPSSAGGLPASVITKLTGTWQAGQRAFAARDLSGVDYVYLWAGGVHVNIRLEEHKLCLLVMIGVRADGRKELIALADGYREPAGSWADLLRDCARRGMRAPVLAAGDGALGFANALRAVFPGTRQGLCWFHKTVNAPHLVALVRAGAVFGEGVLIERPEPAAA